MRTSRRNLNEINLWPGFVDVLGTLLIVTIFTVLISTITQIYFNDQLEIKRGEISNLGNEVNQLIEELGVLEKKKKKIEKKFMVLSKDHQDLISKKIDVDKQLSTNQYSLKMKEKELNDIISERGDLLNNLQNSNVKIEKLSTIKKKMK